MDFLAGYPVLPIHGSILSRPHALPPPWPPTPSERNVTNAPENIVRMKRGKIVTHYTLDLSHGDSTARDSIRVSTSVAGRKELGTYRPW